MVNTGETYRTYPLEQVADVILQLAKAKGKGLTPLQLMKLAYISFGWYLAVTNTRLFHERIEAWRYGPVMPHLYRITKIWGKKTIPLETISVRQDSMDEFGKAFLAKIYNHYGHLTGIQLSSLTHQAGSPWDRVYQDGVPGIEIPQDLIREHYKDQLRETV